MKERSGGNWFNRMNEGLIKWKLIIVKKTWGLKWEIAKRKCINTLLFLTIFDNKIDNKVRYKVGVDLMPLKLQDFDIVLGMDWVNVY